MTQRANAPRQAEGATIRAWVSAIRIVHGRLSPRTKRKVVPVMLLMLLGAAAELVAIGAVVPFLSLLATASLPERLPLVPELLEIVGATTLHERLIAATALFVIAVLAAAAIRLALAWASQSFILRVGHELSVAVQHRILTQPYAYHLQRNSSQAIAALEKVQLLADAVLLQMMQGAVALVVAAAILIALLQIDPIVTSIAVVALAAVYGLVFALVRPRLTRNARRLGDALDRRVQLVQESLGGIRDVVLDHSERLYLAQFRKADRRYVKARLSTAFLGNGPRFVVEAAGMVLIALLALALAARPGGLAAALPVLGALALGAQRLLPLIQQLYYSSTVLAGSSEVAAQVLPLLALPLHASPTGQPPLPLAREITLENVSFRYPGRARPAISNISLTIPQGARVALVGRTGGGKSTLADLLMGLLEPDSGQILVDGLALDGERRRAWRGSIGHVAQHVFLADATIARNIAFSVSEAEIDPTRLRNAAALAQLDAFIASLPDGYGTLVGERGIRLSGGQRQRLGIARAIYKDAPVLVLDEPTSALDTQTERAILDSLDRLQALGRTIVLITHRLSATAGCDLVVRIENGKIAEVRTGPGAEAARTG